MNDSERRALFVEWFNGPPMNGDREALIRKSGRTKGRISQLFDPDQQFGERAARALAISLGLPAEFFNTPTSASLKAAAGTQQRPGNVTDTQDPPGVTIPQFDTGGSMGHGLLLRDQPGVIRSWTVSDEWLQQNVHRISSPKNLAIVTGFGPSMTPLFNPGDPLLVDRGVAKVDIDGVYFFRVGDEGFVKQVQRIPTAAGLILRAKSYNTLYDPFDIVKGMDFEVFGRIVKVWKGEDF